MSRSCDSCSTPAVVHETIVTDGVKTEVHLCAAHAQQRGYILPTAIGPALVVGKLLAHAQVHASAPRVVKSCPTCATTMASVRESGLVGCPDCYRQFEEELGAVISRAQAGASVHVGRHPTHAANLVDRAAMRNKLASELREAIAREEYMRAAKIRDRMIALNEGEPATESGTSS